ncbi:MAG TPA: hypothetical protein VFM24_07005 [Nitrospira sp.]|nr:hypothetical protein [Nitrospira sp.]
MKSFSFVALGILDASGLGMGATMEVEMSDCTDNTQKVVEMIDRAPNSDFQNLIEACVDLTWNQVFLALDRLSRSGEIVLTRSGHGRYRVTRAIDPSPFTHSPGGQVCPH